MVTMIPIKIIIQANITIKIKNEDLGVIYPENFNKTFFIGKY